MRDPSGAFVAGAAVEVRGASLPQARHALTGAAGEFRFDTLASGSYTLLVNAPGFDSIHRAITVRDRRSAPLAITLRLQDLRQQVTVTEHQEGLSVDSGANQNAPRVSGVDLADLPSLDSDYLSAMSRFLDPGAPASVVVDGFEGPSSRVPLSRVKEIRINNNPYSAQFSQPGRGRVEVITKDPPPGLHGDGAILIRDHRLNARDPLALSRPGEQWRTYLATLTGPVGSGTHDSFMLSAERKEHNTVAVIYALTPDGLVRGNEPAPQRQNWFTGRWNHRYRKDRSFWIGYEHDNAGLHRQGMGGPRLPEAAYEAGYFWNEILVSDQGLLSPKLSHSLRGWVGHVSNWTNSLSPLPLITVAGAFTGGGAQQDQFTARTYFVIYDMFTYVRGRHTWTFGAEMNELTRFGASMRNNFGGTYTYASLADYAQGRPTTYSRNFGSGHGVYGVATSGAYVQDEIQVRRGLTLQVGLRYGLQNHFNRDLDNLAPRFGFAWAPRNNRRVLLRGGTGVFYDRQQPPAVVETLLYDGIRVGTLLVNSNDPRSNPNAVSLTRMDRGLRIPMSVHYHTAAEFLVARNTTLTASWIGARGINLFRSDDANAPAAPYMTGRPDPAWGQLRLIGSGGAMTRNAFELAARVSPSRRLTGTAQYTAGETHCDTEGIGSFPATPGDWAAEWARCGVDVRHRLVMSWNADGGRWLHLGAMFTASTGRPVNVTTGGDANRDGIVNDRPAGLGRNSMNGPGLLQLDVRWSRRFVPRDRQKLASTLAVDAFNVLNHANYAGYVGVASSPLFGRPVTALPARRLQEQFRFEF